MFLVLYSFFFLPNEMSWCDIQIWALIGLTPTSQKTHFPIKPGHRKTSCWTTPVSLHVVTRGLSILLDPTEHSQQQYWPGYFPRVCWRQRKFSADFSDAYLQIFNEFLGFPRVYGRHWVSTSATGGVEWGVLCNPLALSTLFNYFTNSSLLLLSIVLL